MARVAKGTDKYKLRPKEQYIALMDLDFSWSPTEINTVKCMWREDKHIADISETIGRDQDEIAVLLIDLSRQGKIERRERGVYGGG